MRGRSSRCAVAVTAIAALMLASCGSGRSPTTTGPSSPTGRTTTSVTAPATTTTTAGSEVPSTTAVATSAVPTTTVPTTAVPTSAVPTTAVPSTTQTTQRSPLRLLLYFAQGDHVGVVSRQVPYTVSVAAAAARQLLLGPTAAERAMGFSTAVPAGTQLLGLSLRDGLATVDLSTPFTGGGGSLSMMLRLAEVTFTLTQFPTIDRVAYRVDGRLLTVLGGEGIVLDHPASRASFEAVTPPILVEQPTPGDAVGNPFVVKGTANVFEAQFNLRVTAADGSIVAALPVTAASGTGTRGAFSITVPYQSRTGSATLTVFDYSPKDGSEIAAVTIPIRLGR